MVVVAGGVVAGATAAGRLLELQALMETTAARTKAAIARGRRRLLTMADISHESDWSVSQAARPYASCALAFSLEDE